MRLISGLMLYLIASVVNAQIQVQDDLKRTVVLQAPAKRIISLAPHVTELLYAAGASDQLVGVVNYSDYPEQAKKIPQIGSSSKFDMEKIVSAKPDLIVAWKSGNPDGQVNELIKLGFTVYYSEPRHLDDVATNIQRLGQLLATTDIANRVAQEYTRELNRIRTEYKERKKISVFYQVWNRPLLTINGEHLISSVINLCGGENVFASSKIFVPQVNVEA
ncbi:MAG: cobalamin-binding protein, partial [Gammaproteobacteria bacterium]|nr:cobalamin-binding protein [Gammaproteobacteria bacterium]